MIDSIETSDDLLSKVIQPRQPDAHKGDNGVVCVVGGSRIFHGAPFFSSMAALRSGADLVYLAVPKLISSSVRALSPDLIVFPLADAKLTTGAASALLKWLPETDTAVIGPGMGRQKLDGTKKLARELLIGRGVKLSVDAEAQNVEVYSILKGRGCITTPHPGEFKRVFGVSPGETVEERVNSVRQKAEEHGITMVLKGATTVISDGTNVYLNRMGSPAMTCGGIGDTLSGVIGALSAQSRGTQIETIEVAAAASYVVGLAGRRAAEIRGYHIVATDIIEQIPYVLKPFDRTAG